MTTVAAREYATLGRYDGYAPAPSSREYAHAERYADTVDFSRGDEDWNAPPPRNGAYPGTVMDGEKKAIVVGAAIVGAAASALVFGPAFAGVAGFVGEALGTASGIYSGSVLGGIAGGSIGTYAAKDKQNKLAIAGVALASGLIGAAAGCAVGGLAGATVGMYVGKALAYATAAAFGGGVSALLARSAVEK